MGFMNTLKKRGFVMGFSMVMMIPNGFYEYLGECGDNSMFQTGFMSTWRNAETTVCLNGVLWAHHERGLKWL